MKSFYSTICAACPVFALAGCLYGPTTRSSISTSNLVTSRNVIGQCPDFTGTYEAVGHLINEGITRNAENTHLFTWIFPVTDPKNWDDIRRGYRRDKNGMISRFPDFAIVKQLDPRAVEITIGYKDQILAACRT